MSNEDTQPPSQDVIFDLLSNPRRRYILRRLEDSPAGIELNELAAELAAMENEVPPEELSSKQRKRTYVSLYQTHVPKLEDAGVVTYESDDGLVVPTDRIEEVTSYFRTERNPERSEPVYPALALLGIVAIGFDALVGVPFVTATDIAVAVLALVVVLWGYRYAERESS